METDPEDAEREKFRRSVKHGIALAFMDMKGATPEQVQEEKCRMIERMTASGVEDAAELIREVFPDL
jgi:hypothetical protein